MPDARNIIKVNNAYLLSILIAGASGGFLTGVLLQIYRIKHLSLTSIFEPLWSGLIFMIFGAPWLLFPLTLILWPFAVGLYFSLPKVIAPTKRNFILVSVVIYCCLVAISHWLGWYEVNINFEDMVSLAPTFIATILFGFFFHKFSQKSI